MVEKMAKMEIKQREVEGDGRWEMGMNNHWLKLKISQFEEKWRAESFNEFYTSYTSLHTEILSRSHTWSRSTKKNIIPRLRCSP